MQEITFYPMLTTTMKSLLTLVEPMDMYDYVKIISTYPNHIIPSEIWKKPLTRLIIQELERQYTRWNKGGRK